MKNVIISVLMVALMLTACSKKMDSSYSIDKQGVVLTLKPNGKAVYLGSVEWDYEVDGKDIKIHRPEGTLILKGHDDGSLDFPLLGNMKKTK